jgi:hypothetical protein
MKKGLVVLCSGVSLLVLCTLAHAFQQEGGSVSGRAQDVYAIYSLMLTNPPTSHGPDDNERYLIRMFTAPTSPQEPCVRPPAEREADFREMRTDYEQRKATPRQLKPALSISKPYVLLSADEAETFIQSRMPTPGQAPIERFKGVTDLFTLSDVYFNKRGTLALTGISTFCGGTCGLFQWMVFERLDGKWEERRWSTCTGRANNGVRSSSALPIRAGNLRFPLSCQCPSRSKPIFFG